MNSENSQNNIFTFYSDSINFKSVDDNGTKRYFIEGHISTEDIDLVNDIVTKECMKDMSAQFDTKTMKLDFEHEAFRGKDKLESEINKTKTPLGKAVERSMDSKGLAVKWELNPTWKKFDSKGDVTMTFKDVWKNVEEGYYDAFSIAYIPTSTSKTNIKGIEARVLDKVNLLNVALTGNPVNTHATMTKVMAKSLAWLKSQEENKSELIRDLEEIKSRLNKLSDNIQQITSNKEDKSDMGKKGEKQMVDKKDEVVEEKPAEAQASEEAKPAAEAETPAAEEQEASQEPEAKALKFDKELVEIKSQMKELKDKNDALEKEVKDYKEIVEKARVKSIGTEDKSKKESVAKEVKSNGPLDYL